MRDFYIFSLVLGVLAFMRFLVAVEFIRVWLARALSWLGGSQLPIVISNFISNIMFSLLVSEYLQHVETETRLLAEYINKFRWVIGEWNVFGCTDSVAILARCRMSVVSGPREIVFILIGLSFNNDKEKTGWQDGNAFHGLCDTRSELASSCPQFYDDPVPPQL